MSIREYLPSKQFIRFFGIIIGIGFLVFVILKFIDKRTELRQEIQTIATREIVAELDTDNDGVKDWEEALWGLDPNNPDTDDDGVLDGQEVEIRRQELKSLDDFVDVEEVPDTETEKIARQVLTIALNIQQASGGSIDEAQIMSIAESLAGSIKPELINFYTVSDIKISSSKTAQSYYQEMSEALGYLNEFSENELILVEQAMATKRERFLDDLGPIIQAYSKVGEKVLDKEIPTQVAQDHLDYINALTQKSVALVSIAQYFKDPIISVRGIEEYKLADQKLTEASNNITEYLRNNGIVR